MGAHESEWAFTDPNVRSRPFHGHFTVISRYRAGLRDYGIIVNGGAVLGCESTLSEQSRLSRLCCCDDLKSRKIAPFIII